MPQDADISTSERRQRARGRAVLDFGADREVAFRRARRHTVLVRIMRVVMPISAIAMFASYGIFMQRTFSIGMGEKRLSADGVSISTEALVAHNPHYEGFDKQGGKFSVRAKTAEQDVGQKGPIRLRTIDGRLTDVNNVITDLKAQRGTFNSTTNVLEMYEKINVVSQNGMTADLTRATVLTKEGRISSDEPVVVHMPSGVVRGNAMTIEQKARQILFSGGVVANLKQEPRTLKPGTPEPAARAASTGLGQSDAPVDITSRQLMIDDIAKRAVFGGDVVATQTDSVMRTPELEVSYEGQPTGSTTPNGAAPAPAQPGQQSGQQQGNSRVKKMWARNGVVLTRGIDKATGSAGEFDAVADTAVLLGPVVITSGADRQVTSDRADLDNKNDTALLTGNVVVTQVKNIMKGRRLFLNRKVGTMELTSPGGPGLAKGRVTALLYQAESEQAAANAKKKGAADKAAPATKADLANGTFKADPNQPIDIDADSLTVDDTAKTATFRGKVRATQGDHTINTEVLVATYSGEAGMATLAGQPQPPQAQPAQVQGAPGQPKSGAQLQKVIAPGKVVVVSKEGQKATGDSAEFDTKANTAILIGNVILAQNGVVTSGTRALLDMGSGTMKILDHAGYSATAPVAGAPAQAVPGGAASTPVAATGAAAASPPRATGRAQLLLFPSQVREEQQKEKDKKAAGNAPAAPAATPAGAAPVAATPDKAVPKRNATRGADWSDDISRSFNAGN